MLIPDLTPQPGQSAKPLYLAKGVQRIVAPPEASEGHAMFEKGAGPVRMFPRESGGKRLGAGEITLEAQGAGEHQSSAGIIPRGQMRSAQFLAAGRVGVQKPEGFAEVGRRCDFR
jgi:hypothetical protein